MSDILHAGATIASHCCDRRRDPDRESDESVVIDSEIRIVAAIGSVIATGYNTPAVRIGFLEILSRVPGGAKIQYRRWPQGMSPAQCDRAGVPWCDLAFMSNVLK